MNMCHTFIFQGYSEKADQQFYMVEGQEIDSQQTFFTGIAVIQLQNLRVQDEVILICNLFNFF